MNLPQATAEETGRELHRMAKTYRSEAYATIGSYMGMNLLVRSEYDFPGHSTATRSMSRAEAD